MLYIFMRIVSEWCALYIFQLLQSKCSSFNFVFNKEVSHYLVSVLICCNIIPSPLKHWFISFEYFIILYLFHSLPVALPPPPLFVSLHRNVGVSSCCYFSPRNTFQWKTEIMSGVRESESIGCQKKNGYLQSELESGQKVRSEAEGSKQGKFTVLTCYVVFILVKLCVVNYWTWPLLCQLWYTAW